MRRFLKGFAVFFGAFMGLSALSAASPQAGVYGAAFVALIALVALVKPLPSLWLGSRITAVAILFVTAAVAVMPRERAAVERMVELENLKKTDPKAYLEIQARENQERQEQDQIKHPTQYVKIEKFSGSKEGFGNVLIANFSIKNELPWPVKDVIIQCRHSAPSGTVIDQNTATIYERFDPNKTKRVTGFNMGLIHNQAASMGCEILSVSVIR